MTPVSDSMFAHLMSFSADEGKELNPRTKGTQMLKSRRLQSLECLLLDLQVHPFLSRKRGRIFAPLHSRCVLVRHVSGLCAFGFQNPSARLSGPLQ